MSWCAGSARPEPVTDQVPVQLRRVHPDAVVPAYAKEHDAGADLHAVTDVTIGPGERALVPTGVAIALPPGWVGLVHPRSGLATRHGVTTLNAPGTIDAGYRGEIQVNLVNHDPREPFTVRAGDRVAQLVLQQVATAVFTEVDSLPDSVRGETGHGSSGGFGPGPTTTDEEGRQ